MAAEQPAFRELVQISSQRLRRHVKGSDQFVDRGVATPPQNVENISVSLAQICHRHARARKCAKTKINVAKEKI
jgi:hypothetical protein